MSLPILQTKLFVPRLRANLVSRTGLTARLMADRLSPLTLVSAPAGFGKTTLVSQWIAQADCPTAWLALDEEDNDPTRFLIYLITALQSRAPALGVSALALLSAPQPPASKATLTLLLNDLATHAAPLVLILDDYHLITIPAIHEAVAFLVEHLPTAFHLVITTRIDPPLPLARWRARNRLTELRADDLRFDQAEAATFLNEMMGLRLESDAITTLTARTEGWIAGLQLAALSMQGRRDLPNFIQAFSGSNRYIVDYLAEEVWQRLPTATQHFLMQTALLERFCADLCAAVTGLTDAQRLLIDLDHANLFLIALDDDRQWYRYHHLFRDLLHQRLRTQADAAAINELHQRAAHWYRAQALTDEAIRHYLAGAATDQAADLIEQVGFERIGQGYLFRLHRWLELLPSTLVRTRPKLALWWAWMLTLTGQPAALEKWLQEAELSVQGLPAPLAQDIQAQITIMYTYQLRRQGKLGLAIAQLQEVVSQCTPENFLTRSTANLNLGFNYWLTGQLALAEQALQTAQTDTKAIDAIHPVLMAKSTQANVAVTQGQLRRAIQLCEETIAEGLAHTGGQPFSSAGYAYAVLGNIWYEQNQWEKAESALTQALELGELVSDGTIIRRAIFRLAPLRHCAGDEDASRRLWQRALTADDTVEAPYVMLQQVRAWLVQANLTGDREALTKANQWAATPHQPPSDLHSYIAAYAQLLNAWLDLLQGQPHQTITRLMPLVESAREAGQIQHCLEMLAVQALAHAAVGDRTIAQVQLHQLLARTAPEGYIRLFVDLGEPMRLLLHDLRLTIADAGLVIYVDKVLAAFDGFSLSDAAAAATQLAQDQPRPSTMPTLIEPLTEREREILHLVADGLSNSEIADQLIVTVGTVKKHLNTIYGKLGVGSRTQAIALLRQ